MAAKKDTTAHSKAKAPSMKVKKGDTVVVLAGKDKGAKGRVIAAYPKLQKVLVEGALRGGSRSEYPGRLARPSGARPSRYPCSDAPAANAAGASARGCRTAGSPFRPGCHN